MKRDFNLRLKEKMSTAIRIHFWSEEHPERYLRIENVVFYRNADDKGVPSTMVPLIFHLYKHEANVKISFPEWQETYQFVRFLITDAESHDEHIVCLPLDGSDPLFDEDIPQKKKVRRAPPCQP